MSKEYKAENRPAQGGVSMNLREQDAIFALLAADTVKLVNFKLGYFDRLHKKTLRAMAESSTYKAVINELSEVVISRTKERKDITEITCGLVKKLRNEPDNLLMQILGDCVHGFSSGGIENENYRRKNQSHP